MPSKYLVNIIARYIVLGSIIHAIFSHINQKSAGNLPHKNYVISRVMFRETQIVRIKH